MLALIAAPLRDLARAAWHNWFFDRHAEFWLAELGVRASSQLSARVVDIIDETPDTRSFVLAVDRRWPGHRAGQFVPVGVEIDGVRTQRCYSISSGASRPGAQRIAITVKRAPGGRVSNWLHDELDAGDIVRLGAPAGDFVVSTPAPLLLVAGGSGITPIMAILRDLEARQALGDVVLVHAARCDSDAIFGRELAAMARQHSSLRLIAHRDTEHGRLSAAALRTLVPDAGTREIYVCGPSGLLDLVTAIASGATVHHERFVAPSRRNSATRASVSVRLRGRSVVLPGAAPLLDELEHAGERPTHGCRMGICHTCRCRKRTGSVEDVATGLVSSEPDQEIRLCVSIARSDLELAL